MAGVAAAGGAGTDPAGVAPAGGGRARVERPTGTGGGPGGRGPGTWASCQAPPEMEARLRRLFPVALALPEQILEAARSEWEGVTVVARSLGRRVRPEWLAKDISARARLGYAVDCFPLADEVFALRFRSPEDQARVLVGGPWVVGGQLVAMEAWRPCFVPGPGVISTASMWLRLPRLPLEFWGREALLAIAGVAGRPLDVDEITVSRRRMGFARVKIAVDTAKPLIPGVLLKGLGADVWQPFVFENAPDFCFGCGRIGHGRSACRFPPLEPLAASGGEGPSSSASVYGPWMAANWLRPQGPVRGSSSIKPPAPGVAQGSPPPRPSPAGRGKAVVSAGKVVDGGGDGWQKPAKVARRVSPARSGVVGGQAAKASSFAALAHFEVPEVEVLTAERLCSALGLPSSGCKRGRGSSARSSSVRAGGPVRPRVGPSASAGSSPAPAGLRVASGRRLARQRRVGSGSGVVQAELALAVLPGGSFGGGVGAALPESEVLGVVLSRTAGAAVVGSEEVEEGEVAADLAVAVAPGSASVGESLASAVRGQDAGVAGGGAALTLGCGDGLHQVAVERVLAALAGSSPAMGPTVRASGSEVAFPMEVSPGPPSCGVQGIPSLDIL